MMNRVCITCNGRGRIARGHDGRQIRCPVCLGSGRDGQSTGRSGSSSSRGRRGEGLPAEINERQGRGSRSSVVGDPPRRGGGFRPRPRLRSVTLTGFLRIVWEWILVAFWFLAGMLGGLVVVPGTGDFGEARRAIISWWRVALIWLGLLFVVIGVLIVAGFIETGFLPWQFTVPEWFQSWRVRTLPW